MSDTFDLVSHLARQHAFSQATFGPGERTEGVLRHLEKEIDEARKNPHDLMERIDIIILGFDGALREGFTPQEIVDGLVAKQTENEGREWPDWRLSDPDQPIEHVRG